MYINTCYGFLILIKYFLVYSTHAIKNSSFLKNIYKNKKPFSKCQRAGKSRLPLLERFRTFKEDIGIENIKLNQLILQY